MTSDRERWTRLRSVFEEALALPAGEREAFLDSADLDAVMRGQLEGMLAVESEDPRFLERPTALGADAPPRQGLPATGRVGAYEIVRPIASGGMGDVYEAVQESPRRRVALKMLRAGPLSPSITRRFQYEAEILARLRHPRIAQIFEAGVQTDAAGHETPWFAMEFVDGARDVLAFAAAEDLGLSARLALFLEICEAVHHGHQRGVIHRDLKPGNLLVDESGHAKVIDFGVARVTDAELSAGSLATRAGELLGTLGYMSPEQLSGDPDAVDTRTDVYSLGVVLYELLCGRGPYDLAGKPVTEVARIILHEPPRDPRSVAPELPDDLRWILLRALEKERERRYASASELAADVRRFRGHEPVQAGPPSARYRLRKFVRRNRLAVAAGTLVVLALVTGTVLATLGLLRAEREAGRANDAATLAGDEADKFRSINDVLTDVLVAVQTGRDGRDVKVAELLDRAAARLGPRLAGRPEVEAALRLALGESYHSLGLHAEAADQARRALALHESKDGPEEAERVAPLTLLASASLELDRLDEARDAIARGLAAVLPQDSPSPQLIELERLDASVLRRRGQYTEAARRLRELHARAARELGDDAAPTLAVLASLAGVLAHIRVDDELEDLNRRLLAAQIAREGAGSYAALDRQLALASVLASRAKLDEAEELYAAALEPMIALLGEEHPRVLLALNDLAGLHVTRGEHVRAAPILEQVVRVRERLHGPEHSETLTARENLAIVRAGLGDTDAIDVSREAYAARRRLWGADHPDTLDAMVSLGIGLVGQRALDEAEPLLLECHERCARVLGDDVEKTHDAAHALAYLYYSRTDFEGAAPWFRSAWQGFRRTLGPEDAQTLHAASNLVAVLGRIGEVDAALPVATEVLALQRERLDPADPNLVVMVTNLAELHRKNGALAQAESLFRQAREQAREYLPPDHPLVSTTTNNLAECLRSQGRCADAVPLFEAAIAASEINPAVKRLEYGLTRRSLGECLATLERPDDARHQLTIAYEVLSEVDARHPATLGVARRLAELLEGQGRHEDAAAWRAKLAPAAGAGAAADDGGD